MDRWADLHLHTHCSDGADAPERVVARAVEAGMSAMAITDHDTLAGVEVARAAAEAAGLAFLSGVEVSTRFEKAEVHVLAYGVDGAHAAFAESLERLTASRRERGDRIVEQLTAAGIPVDVEDARRHSGVGLLGRMQIARALRDGGVTRTVQEGFDRYLNPGRPGWVPKALLPIHQALDLIHDAGGLAFVAHPALSRSIRKLMPKLLALPFDGIEVFHVSHTEQQSQTLQALAEERGLLISGGSDCHGAIKGQPVIGQVKLAWPFFERIAAR